MPKTFFVTLTAVRHEDARLLVVCPHLGVGAYLVARVLGG